MCFNTEYAYNIIMRIFVDYITLEFITPILYYVCIITHCLFLIYVILLVIHMHLNIIHLNIIELNSIDSICLKRY